MRFVFERSREKYAKGALAMEITEVRIKLIEEPSERLHAFCSVTFDNAFVVRDLKIIEGNRGPFVAMPSRKLTDRCPQCRTKNNLRAQYCGQCGTQLGDNRALKDPDGRARLHADIAHPINTESRELIQNRVLEAYQVELQKSAEPGYASSYEEAYGNDEEERYAETAETIERATSFSVSNTTESPPGPKRIEDRHSKAIPGRHHRSNQTLHRESELPETDSFGSGIL